VVAPSPEGFIIKAFGKLGLGSHQREAYTSDEVLTLAASLR